MRFLCLHGMGTNSQILETQTNAIRHQLGDHHTFEYIEGNIDCPAAPGIEALSSVKNSEFLRYFDQNSWHTCEKALADLNDYIHEEGPFDAVMAFSEGACLAATLIIENQRRLQEDHEVKQVFKCAIFFCGGIPYDVSLGRLMDSEDYPETIQIPTAHIWGSNDDEYPSFGPVLSGLCHKDVRDIYIHGGGHEIPGPRSVADVAGAVKSIRKTVERATLIF